ncbi:FecCD family ABC transporter permease [Staphylococcus arlettae]|uniref:FecCD family ABC transporter permease n=1 Tax=Staphylococcus arlettae TaxID=29378 RepID=UPI000D1A78C8|nr:iron ABC transporter permease [Staphylococcus arlettae]PTH24374.1 iron-siderophore ABC transporter permease [Staphylococcus arlettae]PTH26503.1 iron-siderophore ABC transporter permease [Staphylococcus arlettae]PTH53928.1 iron-siderophore ABC transporter permease [Staphylococcus arlettae]PUZ32230.1 iron ABC transporter permease [Staphylococcus arlettae]RIM62234.1 iron ABC transporter permease [Staphylococcus arlettae]
MLLKPQSKLILTGLCLIVVTILSLIVGNTLVPLSQLVQAFFHFDSSNDIHILIVESRASRTIIALLTGAALAVSGLLMQVLTRNPIASPGLFGVNAGAVFFVIAGLTLFSIQSFEALIILAFIGAILVTVVVIMLGMFKQAQFSPKRVILAGAAISALFSAFTQGIMIMNENNLQSFLFWLSGSVSFRNIWEVPWVIPLIVIALVVALALSSRINILMTSDDIATALGQNIKITKFIIIILISVLAGVSVAIAGSIMFVGLIIPNISKKLLPPNYKYLIPFNAISGAILMLLSDIIARIIIQPLELPIGVITAIIGAITLIYIMRKGIQSI